MKAFYTSSSGQSTLADAQARLNIHDFGGISDLMANPRQAAVRLFVMIPNPASA